MTAPPHLPSHALSTAGERLARARRVLAGIDESGRKVHPGMFDAGVISFAHGEGVRRPHPGVVAAGVAALLDCSNSLENYLFLQRVPRLDERIAASFVAEGIEESLARNVCVDCGTTRLFHAFLHAVAQPGDAFLTAPAYYHALSSWCDLSGVELVCVPTSRANGYKLTASDLRRWYRANARGGGRSPRGIFLFNPTYIGSVYTPDELDALAGEVRARDLVVLEDCIFREVVFDSGARVGHLACCEGMRDRVVTLSGGSKAYGLANARIGWACGPKEMIERMGQHTVQSIATVPYVAKAMALAALEAPESYLAQNRAECRSRAALVCGLVERADALLAERLGFRPRVPWLEVEYRPSAGHSVLLSFNGLRGLTHPNVCAIHDSVDVTRFFLTEAGVCISPGISFGFDDCKARVTYGCVGVEHTHAPAREAELLSVLRAVVSAAGPARAPWLAGVIDALAAAPPPEGNRENAGFAVGRALIEEAFLDRMVPALERLVRAQRSRFFHLRLSGNRTGRARVGDGRRPQRTDS